jgi:hypothetical protein
LGLTSWEVEIFIWNENAVWATWAESGMKNVAELIIAEILSIGMSVGGTQLKDIESGLYADFFSQSKLVNSFLNSPEFRLRRVSHFHAVNNIAPDFEESDILIGSHPFIPSQMIEDLYCKGDIVVD